MKTPVEPIKNNSQKSNLEVPVLLVTVLIIAICGILYELLISTISTYFLGSSILHFSVTIGLFLSGIGVGSFLSRFVHWNLLEFFIKVEVWLGFIGGFSAFLLYLAFSVTQSYYLVAFILIVTLGCLIGLEIPILVRLLKKYDNLKNTISNVLAFDYIGSLIASIVFPLLLLPYLGIMRVSFFVGVLNLSIAILNTYIFREKLRIYGKLLATASFFTVLMVIGFIFSFKISSLMEQFVYEDDIVYSAQSKYQKITITKHNQDVRLFINDNLQFSTVDEYRYHEPLVHVPMSLLTNTENVLVLGGGDGLVARELLKYDQSSIRSIDLVDLDPEIISIATKNPLLLSVNKGSLSDPKVHIINEDAYNYIRNCSKLYSLIIIDLPDPNSPSLGKLYSYEFYQMIKKILSKDGILITQSTSPYYAVNAFWCIHYTLKGVFPDVVPMNVYLPTFGIWGFNLAFHSKPPKFYDKTGKLSTKLLVETTSLKLESQSNNLQNRFLNPASLAAVFHFAKDMETSSSNLEINRLDNQALVRYYEKSWSKWE
ncbi:MAG: polyamine aminopropyltransferase [Leptospiraceae bacterium]|nr:polyamine aminopropyltransferase [Leptospiraceae bacterium]